jgi:hypothetical protein
VSVLRVEHLAANTKKGTKLPAVYRVPRPGDDDEEDQIPVVSPGEFAMMTAA